MKILFMIPRMSYTGAPKMMAWTANQMRKRGHDVAIATMYRSETEQALESGVEIINIGKKHSNNWLIRNTVGMAGILASYRKLVRRIKPDVIVSFLDSISYFYIALNKLFFHDKMLVSERVDPTSRRGWRAKVRFTVMKMADHLVFQTANARDYFGSEYLNNSSVIPNPVVMNPSTKRALQIRRAADFRRTDTIVSVGRLSMKQKRQDVLLKAFAILNKTHPELRLLIYGGGDDEDAIRSIISEEKLDGCVEMMGQQSDIPEKIVNARCFVITSDYEGIPNALIEAMSVGLPCVATDCRPGGARMIVTDGEDGFIVPCGDEAAVAEKIRYMVEHPQEAEAMAEKAMNVSERFSEASIAQKWEDALRLCGGCEK